jgi:hypothetical protein
MDLAGTWNTSGTPTAIKLNITDTASNAASLLMDLQRSGTSRFSVNSSTGLVTVARSLSAGGDAFAVSVSTGETTIYNTGKLGWTNAGTASATIDTILTRRGAANLRLGAADAAAPVAQTLSVQGRTGTDAAATAYPFTIQGAQGTGTGAGGSIVFQVAPAGTAGSTPNGLATALTITGNRLFQFQGDAASTLTFAGEAIYAMNTAGTANLAMLSQYGIRAAANIPIGFSNSATSVGTQDVFIYRDAANTLALRNATAAQTFNVYNTFTDASNYERGSLNFASNIFRLETQQLGTGSARALLLRANELYLRVGTSGNGVGWNITSAGNLVATDDNTYDIGASGASRPRDFYLGRNLTAAGNITAGGSLGVFLGNSAAPIYWASRSQIYSPANGNIHLTNSSQNDFGRLQFGGTTSSFPALKRSTTFLQARLADDSAFAGFASANVQAATAYTVATLPTPATGMIARVTDATAPVIGATVAGGGAAYALVNYNGANWTVIGV